MEKPKVGFVCVHNSCRSQMAEALGRRFAGGVFESYSGGTETKPQINQDAVAVIRDLYGIDMGGQRSKLISELPPLDIVVTMGCNVNCPYLPCKVREDWGLDDPTGKGGDAFVKTAKLIESKISDLKKRIEQNQIKEIRNMRIEIYEKALCCETGVCGTDVDTELLRITSLVAELKAKGVDVERSNLSTRPERFIANPLVSGRLKENGVEILPIVIVDGKIVKEKAYPTTAEFGKLTGLKLSGKVQKQAGGCGCGSDISDAEEAQSCGCGGGDGLKQLNVEYLYLDLSCCERCQDAEKNLGTALEELAPELNARGYTASLKKIYMATKEDAAKYEFFSSPTIRVNGADIFDDIKENNCSACGTLCGDDSVECRTFTYKGKGYDAPPVAMIKEAILKVLDGKQGAAKAVKYAMPVNLKKYFTGKAKIQCCAPAPKKAEKNSCCCGGGNDKKGCC